MNLMKPRLGLGLFMAAVVFSFLPVQSDAAANNICCVYYQGSAKSSSCKIAELKSDPDFENTFNGLKDGFACSAYSSKENFITHKNGDITAGGKTGFAVGPEQVVYPGNLKGNYEWFTSNPSGATATNACPPISGYMVELSQPGSALCKVANMERTSLDQAFNFKLSDEIDKAKDSYGKFYQSLQDMQKLLCCYADNQNKNNLATDCKAPEIKEKFKPETMLKESLGLGELMSFQQVSPKTFNPSDQQVAQYFSCDYLGNVGPSGYTLVLRNNNIYCLCAKDRSDCDTKTYLQLADTSSVVGCSSALAEKQKTTATPWECAITNASEIPGTTNFCEKLIKKNNLTPEQPMYTGVDVTELNKLGTIDPKQLIARGIKGLLGVIGSLSLAMFVYGGSLLMIDRGNADQAAKAKEIVVWTSLGLAVIFAAYAIVDFIFGAFS